MDTYPAICPRCGCGNSGGAHAAGCLTGDRRWGGTFKEGRFETDGNGRVREVTVCIHGKVRGYERTCDVCPPWPGPFAGLDVPFTDR